MRKIHFRRLSVPTLAVVLIGVSPLSGCGQGELSRERAAELMTEKYAEELSRSCALAPALAKKPEFASLITEQFCDAEYVVTGIRKVSDTAVVAEARRLVTARKDPLGQWLDSFNALETRLRSIKGTKVTQWSWAFSDRAMSGGPSDLPYWEFVDKSDGQVFYGNGSQNQPADISASKEWQKLENLKSFVIALAENGSSECCEREQSFRLFDDGWRLAD